MLQTWRWYISKVRFHKICLKICLVSLCAFRFYNPQDGVEIEDEEEAANIQKGSKKWDNELSIEGKVCNNSLELAKYWARCSHKVQFFRAKSKRVIRVGPDEIHQLKVSSFSIVPLWATHRSQLNHSRKSVFTIGTFLGTFGWNWKYWRRALRGQPQVYEPSPNEQAGPCSDCIESLYSGSGYFSVQGAL